VPHTPTVKQVAALTRLRKRRLGPGFRKGSLRLECASLGDACRDLHGGPGNKTLESALERRAKAKRSPQEPQPRPRLPPHRSLFAKAIAIGGERPPWSLLLRLFILMKFDDADDVAPMENIRSWLMDTGCKHLLTTRAAVPTCQLEFIEDAKQTSLPQPVTWSTVQNLTLLRVLPTFCLDWAPLRSTRLRF
jgi:hypothetical protein